MAALPYPLIAGVRYDHSSLDVKLAGNSYLGIKSLDWNDALEPGKGYGTAAQKLFRTRGQYDASGSLEMWAAESVNFEQAQISANANTGFYEIVFPIDVTYVSEGGLAPMTTNLVGVRIKKRSESSSAGSEPLSTKYDLDIMYIVRNGVMPITGLRK